MFLAAAANLLAFRATSNGWSRRTAGTRWRRPRPRERQGRGDVGRPRRPGRPPRGALPLRAPLVRQRGADPLGDRKELLLPGVRILHPDRVGGVAILCYQDFLIE